MKILKFKFLLILLSSVAVFSSCKNDSVEAESEFIGNYTISHAAVAETFNLGTSTGLQIPVPVGTDITQSIQAALLSSVSCSSAANSWVELRKDKSMYMSCQGANAINAGTWEEVDKTTLKLNMNSAAIPSSASGYVLTVSNVVKSASGLSGKTSVPMPKEMFAAGMQAFGMTIAATPAVYLVTFSLDFVKK
jgi:hypothetical protein